MLEGSMFEALFIRGLGVEEPLKGQLKGVGVDLDALLPGYHPTVMERCVRLAAAHLYPGVDAAVADRDMGMRMIDGYRRTLLGSVIVAAFPFIGPERLLKRLPRSYGASQNFGRVETTELGIHHWRIHYFEHPPGFPINVPFSVGCFEAVLRMTGITPRAEVVSVGEDHMDTHFTW